MNIARTARERARAELTGEIKDEARRQLAIEGAGGVSLRAIARHLGMVSSAVYRYFPSRDDLLTALIIDAYNDLGAAAEAADAACDARDPRGRWRAVCSAVRTWAREHPHEYALIYGSPVPGYQAPQDTVGPATRVAMALLGVVCAAPSRSSVPGARADGLSAAQATTGSTGTGGDGDTLPAGLTRQVAALAADVAPELPLPTLTRTLIAWTQLFGMISFELFGHLAGSVDPSDDFFAYTVEQMAEFVGLGTEQT